MELKQKPALNCSGLFALLPPILRTLQCFAANAEMRGGFFIPDMTIWQRIAIELAKMQRDIVASNQYGTGIGPKTY